METFLEIENLSNINVIWRGIKKGTYLGVDYMLDLGEALKWDGLKWT